MDKSQNTIWIDDPNHDEMIMMLRQATSLYVQAVYKLYKLDDKTDRETILNVSIGLMRDCLDDFWAQLDEPKQ